MRRHASTTSKGRPQPSTPPCTLKLATTRRGIGRAGYRSAPAGGATGRAQRPSERSPRSAPMLRARTSPSSGTLRDLAQPCPRSADSNWDDVVPECACARDRPRAMSTPVRPVLGLKNLVNRVVVPAGGRPPAPGSVGRHPAGQRRAPRAARAACASGPIPTLAPAGDYAACAIPNAEIDTRRGPPARRIVGSGVGLRPLLRRLRVLGRPLRALAEPRACSAGPEVGRCPARSTSSADASSTSNDGGTTSAKSPTGRSAEYMWAMVDAIGALLPLPRRHDDATELQPGPPTPDGPSLPRPT